MIEVERLSHQEAELEPLDIREMEVWNEFHRYISNRRFTCDIFRAWLKQKGWTERLLDSDKRGKRLNIGGLLQKASRSKNPYHHIEAVDRTQSKVKSNRGRSVVVWKFET